MASNTNPNFTKNGLTSQTKGGQPSVGITAANTKSDGAGTIGTDLFLLYTAGADGTFIDTIRFMPTASAAATATALTTARIFFSSLATGATTNANTSLYQEVALPVASGDNSTLPNNPVDVPLGFRIPDSCSILVSNHVAPNANTAWVATLIGGDY